MSLLTDTTIERVRESADIVEIVSAYTDLRRVGERWTGLCPFHEERTPSFSVDAREKLYYCFGCEAGGDVIKFVREQEGLSFPDAVETLAERYGVELEREEEDPQLEEKRRRRTRLAEVLGRTAEYYATYLRESPKAAKARAYLAGRRLTDQTLSDFGVGYAPADWGTVLELGQRAGFSIPELGAAGLVKRSQKGSYYDHFRSRIAFPIRDARGKVIGFGARRLEGDDHPAKYINSPEGELYHKSRTLYGIDRARGPIGKAGRAVVVEGYMDVLALHQCGVHEAVAVMGTAITPEQLRELASYTDEVVLAMDADRAGREAMLRAQRTVARAGTGVAREVRLKVAAMPAGEDPADMLLAGDEAARAVAAERFTKLADDAVDMPVFHVRSILADADLASAEGRDRALDEAVPVLAGMGETISRDELARELADRLDTEVALVMRRVAQGGRVGAVADRPGAGSGELRKGAPEAQRPALAPRRLSAQEQRERALLAMCVAAPAEGRAYLERLTDKHLSTPAMARTQQWLLEHLEAPLSGLPRDDDELISMVTQIVMRAEREPVEEEAMEINFLELERRAVERRIEDAQRDGGAPPVELQRERAELAERIAHRQAASG